MISLLPRLSKLWSVTLAVMTLFCLQTFAIASPTMQVLDQLEQALRDDRQQNLDILSPKAFQQAVAALEQAKTVFMKKGEGPDFQARVRAVNDARQQAARTAELVNKTIPQVLKARVDALRANAPEITGKRYEEAAKGFGDLISRIESGKISDAKKRGGDVETLFRTAELEAIKTSTITPAQEALRAAEKARAKDYAPLSYHKADSLIAATDKLLSENRYAGEQAVQMAQEAEYQARLSVYLTELARAGQQDKDARERQFIDISGHVTQVARELNIAPAYDQGYEQPVGEILMAVRNLKQEIVTLSKDLSQRNQTINRQQQEADSLRQELTDREAGLLAQMEKTQEEMKKTQQELEAERRVLAAKQAFEQKVKNIESMFTQDEAQVVQERGNLVIHLYGLSFKSGQSIIQPAYFSLLSKVQRAILEFPGSKVVVEGHTDGVGYRELNQKLSEDRAAAVREYIATSLGLSTSEVDAVGYGASRPIGNNATPEGRAKNRRIDIVIAPPGS